MSLRLVVVGRVDVDRTEQIEHGKLLAPRHVLLERLGHGSLLGKAASEKEGLFEELVVDGEVRGHP